NTSYSSKEIAYKLGFSEPTHFSRFFKKHTQNSPNTFRKSDLS
ncbi:MAG: AraC family transcriptional regulator, partial [Prolixibacteraceae bacterium]|nr:AraC family transcriptional regulator [Prolixibacteraceae bacterium]